MSDERLDWSLLLPATLKLPVESALIIGCDGATGDLLVANGVARRWRRPAAPVIGTDDTAPLVVARLSSTDGIADVGAHTAPGGVLVLELERPRWRDRRRLDVRRTLHEAGLTPLSLHHVGPSFAAPRRFVPVDRPGPLAWHVRHLVSLPSPAGSLLPLAAAVAATPLGPPLVSAVSARLLVVALRPAGTSHEQGGLPPPIAAPAGVDDDRVLLLTSGYDRASRTVALVFSGHAPHTDTEPRTVVKIASAPDTGEGTWREGTRLGELHDALDPDVARGLPVPHGCTTVLDRVACEQSCASGPSMVSTISARRRRRTWPDLEEVAGWLDRFGQATRQVTVDPAGAPAPAPWTEIYATFAAELSVSSDVAELAELMAAAAGRSGLAALAVQQHYDTGPWNVHIEGGRPMLVDWELDHLRPDDAMGPALADVLYLVTYWYFLAAGIRDSSEEPAALVRLLADPMPAGHLEATARRVIDRSLAAAGLPRSAVPPALYALWAERARYTDRRRRDHGRPLAPADNVPLQYLQALAAAAPVAFGPHGWWQYPRGTSVVVNTAAHPPAKPAPPGSASPGSAPPGSASGTASAPTDVRS